MRPLIRAAVVTAAFAVVAAGSALVVGETRSEGDYNACGGRHLDGISQDGLDCMDARRAVRWGPFKAFGPTVDIRNED